jgi:phosphatidylglycerol:prolipoprotein diacylglycerol transferase
MTLDAHTAALAHLLLEWLGMAAGAAWWRRGLRAQGQPGPLQPGSFAVLVGLLAGAALGNKLVFLAERPDVAQALLQGQWQPLGQSLVGGLLGGLLGVEMAKRLTGQTAHRRRHGGATGHRHLHRPPGLLPGWPA